MLTYKTNDLIKKAINLCDLKNNSFITNDLAIQLLNDSYIQCYQKLIDIKHEDFLKSVDVKNNDELPDDLYQIAEVYYIYSSNPFKKYNLVKDNDYIIRNNVIKFRENYTNCTYCIDYYPIPEKLTLNDDGIDSHSFEVPQTEIDFASSQFAQVGKYLFVVNGSKVNRIEYGKAKFKEFTLNDDVIDIFATNDALAVNTATKYYVFGKDGSSTNFDTSFGVNTYDADSKEFSYVADVTRRVIIDGEETDFERVYESIKWNEDCFICTLEDEMDIVTESTVNKTFDNPVFISKVVDNKNLIYGEAIGNEILSSFKFTQVFTPQEGTSILTIPNNAFYSLLSYDLAVAMKTIAGEDVSGISLLRDNAFNTFCDTMKKDIQPYVIEDVYSNNNGWWF